MTFSVPQEAVSDLLQERTTLTAANLPAWLASLKARGIEVIEETPDEQIPEITAAELRAR